MKKSLHEIASSKFEVPSIGYISVAENSNLSFTLKRIYHTSKEVKRGVHSHVESQQVLINFLVKSS